MASPPASPLERIRALHEQEPIPLKRNEHLTELDDDEQKVLRAIMSANERSMLPRVGDISTNAGFKTRKNLDDVIAKLVAKGFVLKANNLQFLFASLKDGKAPDKLHEMMGRPKIGRDGRRRIFSRNSAELECPNCPHYYLALVGEIPTNLFRAVREGKRVHIRDLGVL
jgi:hypothetical protein